MECLRRVSVDGETVLVRILGELVDAQTFEYAADVAGYYAPRITGLYDYYLKALGRKYATKIDGEVCRAIAVPPAVVQELMTRQEAASKKKEGGIETLLRALLEEAG